MTMMTLRGGTKVRSRAGRDGEEGVIWLEWLAWWGAELRLDRTPWSEISAGENDFFVDYCNKIIVFVVRLPCEGRGTMMLAGDDGCVPASSVVTWSSWNDMMVSRMVQRTGFRKYCRQQMAKP